MGAANYGDGIVLFDGTLTADQNGAWLSSATCGALRRAKELLFVLDVTTAATDVGDILSVKIQNGLPGSSANATASIIPNDIVRFTNVLGNGGAKTYVARVFTSAAVAATAAPSVALAESTVVNGPISDLIRYVADLTESGTADMSFTFSLKAYIKG